MFFVNKSRAIIGVRSGIFDLCVIENPNTPAIILYADESGMTEVQIQETQHYPLDASLSPSEKYMQFYSISKFCNAPNCYEFIHSSEQQTFKKIQEILTSLNIL